MQTTYKHYSIILLISSLLFIPFLGNVHLFDWDEINFAECAREMIVTGNFSSVQINFQPFWEKPPLFIWMQVLSMKIFGINEFAARFPNAICGIITLVVLYNTGKKEKGENFGLLWAMAYAGSFLPHFYFKSGIIDPWFNLFIFLGLIHCNSFLTSLKFPSLLLSALFTGLAVLTKGPVALLITFICVLVLWLISYRANRNKIISKHLFIYFFALLITSGSWFIIELTRGNTQVINEFIQYQIRLFQTEDSGHGGPFFYHFVVLLIGCFPASILAIGAINKKTFFNNPNQQLMFLLLATVLIIFSIVKTKIIHYSSLAYFPLSYFAAQFCYALSNKEVEWKRWNKILFLIIGIAVSLILMLPQYIDKYKEKIISSEIIKDEFAKHNLQATVNWSGAEFIAGLGLLLTVLFFTLSRGKNIKLFFLFFIANAICINTAITFVVPKIEGYSQGSAIEFYQTLQGKDCYVETLGFKSYAHLFYSQSKESTNKDKMLTEPLNKPCYFVCKINRVDEYKNAYPRLKELYRKNGFVFLTIN